MPTKPQIHRSPGYQPRDERRRQYDVARAPDHNKIYDVEWRKLRKLRKAFVAEYPLCKVCIDQLKICRWARG
jgi:hypothetical protein